MPRWSFLFALILMCTYCSLSALARQDSTSADIQNLVDAWKRRQEEFRTVTIRWTQDHVYPKGALSGVEEVPAIKGAVRHLPGLDKETKYTLRHSFVLGADGRARYVKQGELWHAKLGCNADQNYYSIHNLTKTISYYSNPLPENEKLIDDDQSDATGMGFLSRPSSIFEDNIRYYYAVHMIFRPTELLDVSKLSFAKNSERVGEVDCQVVIYQNTESEKVYYFVDPKRDFLPIKRVSKLHNRIWSTLSVDYEMSDSRWLPKSWTLTAFDIMRGSIRESNKSKVRLLAINRDINESQFDFDFPQGTTVSDRRDD